MDRRAGMRIGMRVGSSIFILVYWRHRAHGRKVVAATIMTTVDLSRRMRDGATAEAIELSKTLNGKRTRIWS
jgi:hypothetical protein